MGSHSRDSSYKQLDTTGPALAAIMVYPQRRGLLTLPGEYGPDRPPPPHQVILSATDGVYVQKRDAHPGSYYVENYRDRTITARILPGQAAEQPLAGRLTPAAVNARTSS